MAYTVGHASPIISEMLPEIHTVEKYDHFLRSITDSQII